MIRRKNSLLSLVLAFVLVLSLAAPALATEEMVAVNETNFPDATFRSYVANNFDTNKDGKLSAAERNGVVEIDVNPGNGSDGTIASLEGIAFFPNLKVLRCMSNQLTSLDVSSNTALTDLRCGYNRLTSLNLSKNAALEILDCSSNPIKGLDVSKNPSLTELYCYATDLLSLDVSKNSALTRLVCHSNYDMTSLNVTGATSLTNLLCSVNALTSLDVSHNQELEVLSCSYNRLTHLDLSKNPALKTFESEWNTYDIIVGPDRTFDLSLLPGGFDISKASAWEGGSVSGNILTVDAGAERVRYEYAAGNGNTLEVYLYVTVAEHPNGDVILRMYNPGNGKHHYTNGVAEANTLVAGGWEYEGFGWIAPKEGAPIYRVYNPGNDNHLYTMDINERDALVDGGWKYEGILCYSAGTDGVPLYRVFNPFVTLNPHHYTDSLEECDFLASNGWVVEGISWYGLK